jgi:ABC-type branched-subunit amino acid transport system ATPase component
VFWDLLLPTSNAAIPLFWQILTGWALTSASIFSAMFFNRAQLSGIYSTIGFLIVGLGAQLLDRNDPTRPGNPSTGSVAALSLLFPSMNYVFMLGYMCRYEEQGLATNLLHAPPSTSEEPSNSRVPGYLLLVYLVLQIFVYPVLAVYTEKWIHGTRSRARMIGISTDTQGSPIAIETSGLTKVYRPKFYRRWFSPSKCADVVAVRDLDLVARKGQVVCLLGANGSGKTTTLDMISGVQKLTSGSIRINAASSHMGKWSLVYAPLSLTRLGICPQRNVLWDELTVGEHVRIWNDIKFSREDKEALGRLVEACDLTIKKGSRAGTLSGGQKRKLQLACMFVGGSTVCLLDEATSGLVGLTATITLRPIR